MKNDGRLSKKSICGVALRLSSLQRTKSTPHSSRLARLASGASCCAVHLGTFSSVIKNKAHLLGGVDQAGLLLKQDMISIDE